MQHCAALFLFIAIFSVKSPNGHGKVSFTFDADTDMSKMAEDIQSWLKKKPREIDLLTDEFNNYKAPPCVGSMVRLQRLYKAEGEIVRILSKIVRRNLNTLDTFSKDIMKEVRFARKRELQAENFLLHPLNVLHFLKRQSRHLPTLTDSLIRNDLMKVEELREVQKHRSAASCLASVADVNATLLTLSRISRAYKLNKKLLIDGAMVPAIGDEVMQAPEYPLKIIDCAVMILVATDIGLHHDAADWASHLLQEWSTKMDDLGVITERIIRAMAVSYEAIGDYENAKNGWEVVMPKDKEKKQTTLNVAEIEESLRRLSRISVDETPTGSRGPGEEWLRAEALCRRESDWVRELHQFPAAKCRWSFPVGGWWRFDIEELSTDPLIILFHKALHASERRKLIAIAEKQILGTIPKVTETSIQDPLEKERSESTWVSDKGETILQKLSQRITLIVGLPVWYDSKTENPTSFKVTSFGSGGHASGHLDYMTHADGLDRKATWEAFLSDVDGGGDLVFPALNITVPVEEGVALFWFNLKDDGSADPRTHHTACPVMVGSKLVATMWFRETCKSRS